MISHWRLRLLSWTILLYACFLEPSSSQKRVPVSDCEKQSPVSFNPSQRIALCKDHLGKGDVSPALCAAVAKDLLKSTVSTDDVVRLCQNAHSSAPAKCMHTLDANARKQHGLLLCSQAVSSLPGECFADISKLKTTGTQKVNPKELLTFCASIGDSEGPLECVKTSLREKSVTSSKAFELCGAAVGGHNATSYCLRDMKRFLSSMHGIQVTDLVAFCATAVPEAYSYQGSDALFNFTVDANGLTSPLGRCYSGATEVRSSSSSSSSSLNIQQRLALCENAPPFNQGLGPVACARSLMPKLAELKIQHADVLALCAGAVTDGPALCFFESKGLGSAERRMQLCSGATNSGPAQCIRRVQSLFRNDEKNQDMLCVGTDSVAPAECVSAAPLYLTSEEKVHLCANAVLYRGHEPPQCLQAVESPSRLFAKAPTKGLGVFVSQHMRPNDKTSRELLVNMCSFSASKAPLASAECIKSAPKILDHDEAVRLCTDISSAEVMQHMPLCMKLLPKEWTTPDAALLCDQTINRAHVEVAIKCALDVQALTRASPTLTLNRTAVAALCRHEYPSGALLECAKAALQMTSPPARIAFEDLLQVCAKQTTTRSAADANSGPDAFATATMQVAAGQCLNKVGSMTGSSKMELDSQSSSSSSSLAGAVGRSLASHLCSLDEPLSKLKCLIAKGRRIVSVQDIQTCGNEVRVPHSVKIVRLLSADEQLYATAGRAFSVWMRVFDQWGDPYTVTHSSPGNGNNHNSKGGVRLYVSINDNNPQGAVLWGVKANETTPKGLLQFDQLVVSQPGQVQLKVYMTVVPNLGPSLGQQKPKAHTLGVFLMDVRVDPDAALSTQCVFLFHRAACSSSGSGRGNSSSMAEADYLADFPRARSLVAPSSSDYLASLATCLDTWQSWHISVFPMMPDATVWVEYKAGVDAMWTGVGFPTQEMALEDRLELPFKIDSLQLSDGSTSDGDTDSDTASDRDVITPGDDGGGGAKRRREKDSASSKKQQQKIKGVLKEVRRAYYRKSLQWHPDRWAGMSRYHIAVQGAFELVNEAYEALNQRLNSYL